jgi:hypothetical protein
VREVSPLASWALLVLLLVVGLLALRASLRRSAEHAQRRDDRLRAERESRDRFDVARARNHYGVPCSVSGCGCADDLRRTG